ncbi:MAG: hypothetical protein GY820_10740 [Gammaproteobacteria bacterium]|nr:hypothetical protein [Gammaproteobacteria bacterium]
MKLRFWRQKWSRTEVRFSFHPARPGELSIKKKFDPIRSSIKNFLNSGMRGEIWYQYRHLPSGKGSA